MKTNEAAKPTTGVAPAGAVKGKEPDADEAAPPPAPPKPGLLPTGLSRAMVIGALLLFSAIVGVGLFGGRYALISALRTENAIVYRIDRMTGRVSFCSPAACMPVPEKADGS